MNHLLFFLFFVMSFIFLRCPYCDFAEEESESDDDEEDESEELLDDEDELSDR
jgi:hypothetical protein